MFEILEKSLGNVIGFKVHGKLVHEDYAQFVPKLEEITKMGKTIFSKAKVRYFEQSQSQEAWDWICEGVESSGTPEQEVTATTV